MVDFVIGYLIIGVIFTAIFELIIKNRENELIEEFGEDFKITNSDRVISILIWPFSIIYLIFA